MTAEDNERDERRLQRLKRKAVVEQWERRFGQICQALVVVLICALLAGSAIGSPTAVAVSIFIAAWVIYVGLYLYFVTLIGLLTFVAYHRIRRLGYFPNAAAMLAVSVLIVAIVIPIGTAFFLPATNIFWGQGEILICVGEGIAILALGCAILVRKLPKRSPRVFGPRRARVPFVWGPFLITVGIVAPLFAVGLTDQQNSWITIIFACGLFSLILYPLLRVVFSPYISDARERLRNQTTIEDGLKLDARSPVVFLRPFAAEELTFVEDVKDLILNCDKNGGDRFDVAQLTFEQYLGAAFRERIGPFVALGNPEDYLPRPGAIRTYAADEDWYEYFERLAGQAACIVMTVSNSDNLQRELTFIRREGLQPRLFIFTDLYGAPHGFYYTVLKPVFWLMLQLYGPPRFDEKATWVQLAQSVKKLGFDLGDDPGRGAVVTFDSEGKIRVLVKEAGTPSEFVEPIREYLGTTLGLDLGEAAAKAESHQAVAACVPSTLTPKADVGR